VSRPSLLVVVAGTGTGVGKTWVAAAVASGLRARGLRVEARKPAQSFAPAEAGGTDAEVLAAATGEDPAAVCPRHRWYGAPMAPPMAADALGRPPFTVADLAAEVAASWGAAASVGLVELAGGPRSPMAADGDGVDLTRALDPDLCVLVADAGLGTINAVRLCTGSLAPRPVVVFTNRYDAGEDLHRRNVAWLREIDGVEIVTDVAELTSRLVGQ
jgi:dethiobiotin synthetase